MYMLMDKWQPSPTKEVIGRYFAAVYASCSVIPYVPSREIGYLPGFFIVRWRAAEQRSS